MGPIYNDELYHFGILGMKWKNHRTKVKVEQEKQKAEDKSILEARVKTKLALDTYNRKANYSNQHINDKKAFKAADDALDHFLKLNTKANMKTHAEKGRAKAIKALLIIGGMSYVSGIAYSAALLKR